MLTPSELVDHDNAAQRREASMAYRAAHPEDSAPVFVLLYVLHFSDGGEPECEQLHHGTKESCERLAELLPAISYGGPRPVLRAEVVWGPEAAEVVGGAS